MSKVIKFNYTRNTKSKNPIKYLLVIDDDGVSDLSGLEISRLVEDDNRADRKKGFEEDKGRSFAFTIHRAIQAGYQYEEALRGWEEDPYSDIVHRPTVGGMRGVWRSFKRDHVEFLGEWNMERTFQDD